MSTPVRFLPVNHEEEVLTSKICYCPVSLHKPSRKQVIQSCKELFQCSDFMIINFTSLHLLWAESRKDFNSVSSY